ncbi:MAG: tetratricopeptide repeat protein [Ectothiorhodospiraceae bacterium]|nr:tetratricopeptide repeat protein [Ectothiorhodospiraceae bacterium]
MNVRMIWWLGPVAALLLAACGDSVDELMERGLDFQEQGRYQSAMADYRSVLQEDSDHAEARFRFGEVSLLLGENAAAEDALRSAGRRGIAPERVQPLLATALLRQNKAEAVLQEIDPTVIDDSGVRADLLASRAIAYAQLGRMDDARQTIDRALEENPHSVSALVFAGRMALGGGRLGEATLYIGRALEANPDSPAAWLTRAEVEREVGNEEEAKAAYTRVLELNPTDITGLDQLNTRGRLAELLLSQGDLDAARQQVRDMLRQASRHPYSNYLAGLIALVDGDLDTANERLQIALSVAPDNVPAKALMGDLRFRQGRYEQTISLLRDVVAARPGDLRSRVIYAAALREVGDMRRASQVLEDGLEQFADNPQALAALGGVQMSLGQDDAAQQAFERMMALDPDSPQTNYSLAVLAAGQGRTDEAVQRLERVLEQAPDSLPAMLRLAEIHQQREEHQEALRWLEAAVDRAPENPELRFRLARAQAAVGDEATAMETLYSLVEDYPDRPEAPAVIARMQLREGHYEAALETSRRLQELDAGRAEGALLEGHAHSAMGNDQAAADAYQRAVDAGRRDALGPLVAHRHTLGVEDPAAPAEAWVERNPGDLGARISLAEWYGRQGDYARMVRQYEAVLEQTESPGAALLNNLAWGYGQIGDERAMPTARRALEMAPDNAAIMDTVGWIALRQGDVDEAVELLSQASAAAPDDARIRYHYAEALAQSGDHAAARREVELALNQEPESDWTAQARELLERLD